MPQSKRRSRTQLRSIRISRQFTKAAPGSVLIEMGNTKVLCTASWEPGVPAWRKDSGMGWVTAEYSMLPGSTAPRKSRPRSGHTDSRGLEIQRLIGRTLRAVVDYEKLRENTIVLDCDVIQADGGTRTAAINGSFIALSDAVRYGLKKKFITQNPITQRVAAVSVGLIKGNTVLDLDYNLDSIADVDMNIAMTESGRFVEVQGSAEKTPFSGEQLEQLLNLARRGIKQIFKVYDKALRR
ncbi:MAG: ribonuclease PH [Sedimentisphaerales bacterium]|nr:ribonuclease PH [Sedimentisphaerales bacterium]